VNLDQTHLQERPEPRLGALPVAMATLFYVLCVSIATWPRIAWFRSCLPSLFDPLQHLWIMRWYRACLLEGQSPVLCPEIQYPTGVPLGCYSPLHLQAMLYIPLSLAIPNDALCYNLVWLFGMVTTGLGTFLLTWRVIEDRWCAGFAGMLAMLSAPMMFHASAHLELIFLGAFPVFLWTWLRLFDRPTRGRLAAAVGGYILVTISAAYYAVFAIFPAALYFFWKGLAAGRAGAWPWFRSRGPWLLAFSVLVVPALLIIFSNHIWAMAHGYALPRSFAEFKSYSAPLWGYACPTGLHALGRRYPSSWWADSGLVPKMGECSSYLGVVALGLLAYAAAGRARFRDGWYWWACLAMIVVLSGGTGWTILGHEITLPSLWLKKHFALFQLIRVPARFNLHATVLAALVAASGLHHLLAHLPRRWMRGAVLAALSAVAVADLAMVPYFRSEIPAPPGCYAFMQRTAPGAPFVEVPQSNSGGSDLYTVCAYWQSIHRGRTTAGYCGQGNAHFDNLLTYNSPFLADALARPEFLEDPSRTPLELGGEIDFRDYAWLYLKAHGFRFVVVHRGWSTGTSAVGLERLMAELEPAKVFDDTRSIVYDRDRLALPAHPVVITTGGWRLAQSEEKLRVAERQARALLYNPDPDRAIRLTFDARALRETRHVRLVSGGKELARWSVKPDAFQWLSSPPFRLAAGLHDLVLESDAVARPKGRRESALPNDLAAFSMRVDRLEVESAPDTLARRPADEP
jgi:hypothetical protein